MPELPEVETYRSYLTGTCLQQVIVGVDTEDPKKLLLLPETEFQERIKNRKMVGSRRVGKNLFMELDNGEWLYMHFGMTGDVHYYRDHADKPKHARIVFYFENGFKLGFICPRKFERIGIVENVDAFLKQKKVNEDVLSISFLDFKTQLQKRKSIVKTTLLDQSVVAGIGNWIADDVLFKSKVNPSAISSNLSESSIKRIFDAMLEIVKLAIEKDANYVDFPAEYLIHARGWGKHEYSSECPNCTTELSIEKIGGRTTFYCTNCQPLT